MMRKIFIENRQITVWVVLALFLITLPISYDLNSKSAILVFLLFFLEAPKQIKQKLQAISKNKLYLIFLAYYLVQVLGLLYSKDVNQAIRGLQTLLPFITLPLLLLTEPLDKQKTLKLLSYFRYYLFFGLIIALIYQYIVYNNIMYFEHELFAKVDIISFYFSAFIYLAIILSLFELKQDGFKGKKNYFFIAFFSWVLLLLGARVSILILLIALVLLVFNAFKEVAFYKKAIIAVIFACSFLALAYQIPQVKRKVDISARTIDFDFKTILTKNQISITRNSIEYRILINYCSLSILKSNLLGVGIGDYREELSKCYQNMNFRAGIKRQFNCHNQYMEEFLKQGVIGGFIFILLMVFIMVKGYQQKGYLYYVGLYVVLVCFVESYFYRQHGVMFTAFFIPLFYNLENQILPTKK